MARQIATTTRVDRAGLEEFLRESHQCILITTRDSGRLQTSPVTCGLDPAGRVVIATYPERAKVVNLRKRPAATLCIFREFNGAWVQVEGTAEVLDVPEAVEPLVEYYRSISGEHPDWDEYRAAMLAQDKSLIRVTIERWGPIATGGFPPRLADS